MVMSGMGRLGPGWGGGAPKQGKVDQGRAEETLESQRVIFNCEEGLCRGIVVRGFLSVNSWWSLESEWDWEGDWIEWRRREREIEIG